VLTNTVVQHRTTPCNTVGHRATLCNTVQHDTVKATDWRRRMQRAEPYIPPPFAESTSAPRGLSNGTSAQEALVALTTSQGLTATTSDFSLQSSDSGTMRHHEIMSDVSAPVCGYMNFWCVHCSQLSRTREFRSHITRHHNQ
jgi:hypothetical protein